MFTNQLATTGVAELNGPSPRNNASCDRSAAASMPPFLTRPTSLFHSAPLPTTIASMSFSFGDASQRVLPRVIEALQRLQQDPNQLAHERDDRFDEPPPYSESGETTQPPTPGPAVVDETYQRYLRQKARNKSMALDQFKSQASRERDRLEHQLFEERYGRRQTLPWDDSCDLIANSENNVRSRWVEQGIWGDEWGPAWPRSSLPSMTLARPDGPFSGSYHPTNSEVMPGARWGHEKGNSPQPSPSPERQPPPGPWIWDAESSRSKSSRQPEPTEIPIEGIRLPIPRPTVRDPEASRPLPQFLYQISKEREWIKDEIDHNTPGRVLDLDALAYESVKENWTKDGIWNPKWGDLPGPSWIHEEPEEPTPVDSNTPVGGPPDIVAEDNRQPTLGTRQTNLFTPASIPEAINNYADDNRTQTSTEAGATNIERRSSTRAWKTCVNQLGVADGTRSLEEAPRQLSRNARSTMAENQASTVSFSTPRREGRHKRSRDDDIVKSEQPPKRTRYNNRYPGVARVKGAGAIAETPNGSLQNPQTISTRRVTRARAQGGDGKAMSSGEGLRRSARIAERERQRRANVAAEVQQQPSRPQPARTSKTSMTAKSGRIIGRDQRRTPRPKRGKR